MTVKTLEKGFMINVFSKKSCPGLLVSMLEAFEELGLNVLEARVSCTDTFSLQAIGGVVRECISMMTHLMFYLSLTNLKLKYCFYIFQNEEQGEPIDAQVVKQALLQVIRNWSESNEQD